MKPHTATLPQHTATPPQPPACPTCGFAGLHYSLGDGWLECGRPPTRTGPATFTGGCGATWQTIGLSPAIVTANGDPDETFDRVIDILDAHRRVGIIDTTDGATVLDWATTSDFAHAIASDPVLADLISRRQLGGAA